MNKNRKKNRETESTAEAKLKGFLDMIAHPLSSFIRITISVEIPTGVSGHSVNTRQPRMNRRF